MEKRYIENKVELRAEGDKTYIEGYGILFNSESKDLGGFKEVIEPSALDEANMSDVIGRAEHSNDYVLGRTSSGTMELSIDERGVKYTIEAPNTTVGRDVIEYIKRGDLVGSSFAFSGVSDKWTERNDGSAERTITGIAKIHDIGPVFNPAYADTTTALRSLEEWRDEIKDKKPEDKKPEVKETPKTGLSITDKVRLQKLRG